MDWPNEQQRSIHAGLNQLELQPHMKWTELPHPTHDMSKIVQRISEMHRYLMYCQAVIQWELIQNQQEGAEVRLENRDLIRHVEQLLLLLNSCAVLSIYCSHEQLMHDAAGTQGGSADTKGGPQTAKPELQQHIDSGDSQHINEIPDEQDSISYTRKRNEPNLTSSKSAPYSYVCRNSTKRNAFIHYQ